MEDQQKLTMGDKKPPAKAKPKAAPVRAVIRFKNLTSEVKKIPGEEIGAGETSRDYPKHIGLAISNHPMVQTLIKTNQIKIV